MRKAGFLPIGTSRHISQHFSLRASRLPQPSRARLRTFGVEPTRSRRAPLSSAIRLMKRKEHAMTIIRCTDNDCDNTRMNNAGYEIIAIETYDWPDGYSETEIIWAKDGPIEERELPY
jgi:hypothetical protein